MRGCKRWVLHPVCKEFFSLKRGTAVANGAARKRQPPPKSLSLPIPKPKDGFHFQLQRSIASSEFTTTPLTSRLQPIAQSRKHPSTPTAPAIKSPPLLRIRHLKEAPFPKSTTTEKQPQEIRSALGSGHSVAATMKEGRPGAGDYIASLLSSSPRLDFGGEEEEEDCLDRFCGDPGFAARAARLSSFSGQRFAVTAGLFGLPPPLSAASGGGEFAGSREASSVSDPASAMKDANAKKRKAPAAAAKGKSREPSAQVRVCFCLCSAARIAFAADLASVPAFGGATDIVVLVPCPSRHRQGSRRVRTPRGGARRREARGRRGAP